MESKTKNYELNDEELVYLISESGDAKDELYKKYSPMIHKELNKVKNSAYALGIDWSDLIQEAMLGFSNALSTYNESGEAKFSTYATLCVRRKLLNFIDKHATKKNMIMKSAVSLDAPDSVYGSDYSPYLKDIEGLEPLNKVITDESLEEVSKKFDKLNYEEKRVMDYTISGKSPSEISELMNISIKKVYNILYRARNKIKIEK